jgi:hypothetical protein
VTQVRLTQLLLVIIGLISERLPARTAWCISFQRGAGNMIKPLVEVIRHSPLLWMLVFVPVALVAETIAPRVDLSED